MAMVFMYPFMTHAELEQAGKALQRAFIASPQDADWTEVRWNEGELCIRQKRPILGAPQPMEADYSGNEGLDEIEDEDEEMLRRRRTEPQPIQFVDFSIVLSPTYQVPILWFTSSSIPTTGASAVDDVYERIVSPSSQTELRQVGVLGGISIAEHPLTSLPAFFVHPCRTPDNLDLVRPQHAVSATEYMMLWFGIIGSSVGLSVPPEIARSFADL